jgi:hypothetical protein
MPHIVFNGKADLEKIHGNFTAIFLKNDSLIKIKDAYLNTFKNNLLLSTLVIDELHQEFIIQVLSGSEKTTVRLYPLTDPQKTDSVKKAIVLVSKIIQKNDPELQITKTNLQDYLSNSSLTC